MMNCLKHEFKVAKQVLPMYPVTQMEPFYQVTKRTEWFITHQLHTSII